MKTILALCGIALCLIGAAALGRRHAELLASPSPAQVETAHVETTVVPPDPDAGAALAIQAFGDAPDARASGALPTATLEWLAERAEGPEAGPKERTAALRALARFGGRGDRQALLARLRDATDGAERELAAAGLSAARDEDTAVGLAEAIDSALDESVTELAAGALAEVLMHAGPAGFSPQALQMLETTLLALAEQPAAGARARQYGLSALASLGGPAARATLLRSVCSAEHEPELAVVAAAELARMDGGFHLSALAEVMLDQHLSLAARDVAATELCRHAGQESAVVLGLACTRVQRVAESDPSPAVRSRALDVLAASGQAEALATLAHSAWNDSDPTVRAAAVRGLALADEHGEWDHVLETQSREDPDPDVRALAAVALEARYALK